MWFAYTNGENNRPNFQITKTLETAFWSCHGIPIAPKPPTAPAPKPVPNEPKPPPAAPKPVEPKPVPDEPKAAALWPNAEVSPLALTAKGESCLLEATNEEKSAEAVAAEGAVAACELPAALLSC